jgi:hypothetical protein
MSGSFSNMVKSTRAPFKVRSFRNQWAADMANLALQITPPPYQVQTQCSWAGRINKSFPSVQHIDISCLSIKKQIFASCF